VAVFGPQIYKFDMGLLYGRVFAKLKELISDIEELREERDEGEGKHYKTP
jgi:hypothetical protein